MPAATFVILAAGEGTRMNSKRPKLLHDLCGRPLIHWPVRAAIAAGADRVVVVDNPRRRLAETLAGYAQVELAIQEEAKGTGDAVKAAGEQLRGAGTVVVLLGDVPLIEPDVLRALIAHHEASEDAATMVTMQPDDPTGYGRVVRAADGSVERVVETKREGHATPEQLLIREVNTGVFAFDGDALAATLAALQADNPQGEYFLPDTIPALAASGRTTGTILVEDASVTLGVNDREDLALVRAHARERINSEHSRNGVTLIDPTSAYIDLDVRIGRDTTIEPGTILRGTTVIGEDCVVGPHSTLIDTTLDDGVTVLHSHLVGARVGEGVSVGPYAYLRPGADVRAGGKVGTFVEVKNSTIGAGSKVPHLSYIGDADIGERSNIGAGTITANYDGFDKHRTTIGDRVRISVDTALVAPVTVGDDAYTAAGSVITKDVPAGALGVARERQRNVEGYAQRRAEAADEARGSRA